MKEFGIKLKMWSSTDPQLEMRIIPDGTDDMDLVSFGLSYKDEEILLVDQESPEYNFSLNKESLTYLISFLQSVHSIME